MSMTNVTRNYNLEYIRSNHYNQVQSGTIRYHQAPVSTSVPGTRCTKKTKTKSAVLPTSLGTKVIPTNQEDL